MTDTHDGEAVHRGSDDQRGEPRRRKERPRRSTESEPHDSSRARRDGADTDNGREHRKRTRLRASQIAQIARGEIHELTGRQVEGVTSVQRSDTGWQVGVEVVESHRIPDTTDILAVYEADIDETGELSGYRRVDRYSRGKGYER